MALYNSSSPFFIPAANLSTILRLLLGDEVVAGVGDLRTGEEKKIKLGGAMAESV